MIEITITCQDGWRYGIDGYIGSAYFVDKDQGTFINSSGVKTYRFDKFLSVDGKDIEMCLEKLGWAITKVLSR